MTEMRLSTTLETLEGRGSDGQLGRELKRLAQLGSRVLGLVRRAHFAISVFVVKVFVVIRTRLESAAGSVGRGKRMRLVESLALGGRRQLLLVKCDEQEYLVGIGPDSVETIVLRQAGEAAPTGAGQPSATETASAQGASPFAAAGKERRSPRTGMMFRERPEHGPWLVRAGCEGETLHDQSAIRKNRIEEAGSNQGRESWK